MCAPTERYVLSNGDHPMVEWKQPMAKATEEGEEREGAKRPNHYSRGVNVCPGKKISCFFFMHTHKIVNCVDGSVVKKK
jgi:hypothetical protein